MTVKTYRPRVRVFLDKNIQRTKGVSSRYTGSEGYIELTDYLGDAGGVTTSKIIDQPMGTFQIVMADKMAPEIMDSLYGMIEPMDHITIHMARNPSEYPDLQPPVVMRGFVTNVSRRERMGNDGKPVRQVIIAGNDYGRAFVNLQVMYLQAYASGTSFLTKFRFYERYGVAATPQTASGFMNLILGITNEYLKTINLSGAYTVADQIKPDITVGSGVINPFGALQAFDGPMWNLMAQQADRPWNELFVEDRSHNIDGDGQDGPYLVYRPSPYHNVYATEETLIKQAGVAAAKEIDVSIEDVQSLDVTRSDKDVANFYWVNLAVANLFPHINLVVDSLNKHDQTVFLDNPVTGYNVARDLYGDRILRVTARQGNSIYGNLKKTEHELAQTSMLPWLAQRRIVLQEMNRDNVVLESGSMTLKGNERLRIGTYLNLKRGSLDSKYYLTGVTQQFSPFSEFTTAVTFIRGTGFLERSKVEPSPYLAEGRSGPYNE